MKKIVTFVSQRQDKLIYLLSGFVVGVFAVWGLVMNTQANGLGGKVASGQEMGNVCTPSKLN